jgi:DNA-binding GntR family transcriptional regulator
MGSTVIKKSSTLREQVVDVLLNELRSGEFAPGERLTEQGLAERLDVSRTPIREALNQLMEQGLLQARPRGGYVVPSPTVEEIRQIIAVRMLLEPPAVRMAAAEYQAEQIDKISQAIEREALAAPNPRPVGFARANEEFRRAMFDRISNQALRGLIASFANHLHFIRAATLRNMELRRQIVDRQRKIRDAIATRDGDMAEGLWRSYLRLTEESLVIAMGELAAKPHEGVQGK